MAAATVAPAPAGLAPGDRIGSAPTVSRNPVEIDDARVAILKSYPIQARLILGGRAPEPCRELRVGITYGTGTIDVTVPGCEPAGDETPSSSTTFQAVSSIPLRGLAEGPYTVRLDGRPLSDLWYPAGHPPDGGDLPPGDAAADVEIAAVDTGAFAEIAWAADCAAGRNRLHLIDDALVLWTRSDDACADAAWAATLYGTSPDDVRCRAGDSIAGPRLECRDPALRPLFEAALGTLHGRRSDLGDEHAMTPLWAGIRVPLSR